jgi:hypothetical protein
MAKPTRQLVKDMIEQRYRDLDEYKVPVVVDEVTALIRKDKKLYAAYVNECLREMVHNEALGVVAAQRIRARRAAEIQDALDEPPLTSPASLIDLEKRLNSKQSDSLRWLKHAEYIGGRHIKIMAMTGRQLDLALSYRLMQRDGHDLKIRFMGQIRAAVADDQAVEEVFSAEQLEELYQRARSKRRDDPPATDQKGS